MHIYWNYEGLSKTNASAHCSHPIRGERWEEAAVCIMRCLKIFSVMDSCLPHQITREIIERAVWSVNRVHIHTILVLNN